MINNSLIYGNCPDCFSPLEAVFFTEKETRAINGFLIETGRKRRAVDYLICPYCLKKQCVDDSFDGPWYMERK